MKKNSIDQVFKDRLKDYQETPEERVWESISASLDKKKSRRRVIPLWWRLGGIAAALALLIYVFLPAGSEVPASEVTDSEKPAAIEESATPGNRQSADTLEDQNAVVEQGENATEISGGIPQQPAETTKIVRQEAASKIGAGKAEENRILTGNTELEPKANQALANRDTEESSDPKRTIGNEVKEAETRIAKNDVLIARAGEQNPKNPDVPQEAVVATEKEKKSIFEALEEQEEEAIAEATSGRWSVGPMVAPVYFNTLTEGSPIHSNFVANSKSGNVNLSYGVAVSYQITDKLSVRSGLHRVDYGYDTDEIRFSSSLTASTSTLIDNIDYDTNSRTLVVESQASRGTQESAAFDANEVNAPSPAREGRMVQDFGYLEVPMELQYNLIDKKLGVNLIGGLSSLFLMENSVTLVADDAATSMGEANNINEVNFSTNVGLGLYYRFTPKMQLNLEPMFKYQLNTFSESAGNFQPFSVGVYSGLSFKF